MHVPRFGHLMFSVMLCKPILNRMCRYDDVSMQRCSSWPRKNICQVLHASSMGTRLGRETHVRPSRWWRSEDKGAVGIVAIVLTLPAPCAWFVGFHFRRAAGRAWDAGSAAASTACTSDRNKNLSVQTVGVSVLRRSPTAYPSWHLKPNMGRAHCFWGE